MSPDSSDFTIRRVAIIGVGLLGGSVAKSLRRADPHIHVVGVSRSPQTRRSALDGGVIDEACESVAGIGGSCDVVVVATPVDRLASLVIASAAVTSDACLITDVGSTKQSIVDAVKTDPVAASKFVGAHPIAGSEKTGVAHATEDLFDEKVVIITPTDLTTDHRHRQAAQFWRMTGARCLTMTPGQHDCELAAVSHTPHLISALVAQLASPDSLPLVGSGWRDITRVAAGDPEMWTAICLENHAAILRQLTRCTEDLLQVGRMIQAGDGDGLRDWFDKSKTIRDQADS